MEAKLTELTSFPMKLKYELVKRTLPLTIIRPAEFYDHGNAVDVSGETPTDVAIEDGVPAGIDKEDPPDTGVQQVPGVFSESGRCR